MQRGKFDRKLSLNIEARLDILWWRDNFRGSWSPIIRNNPDVVKTTDASTLGWGAETEKRATHQCSRTHGRLIWFNPLAAKDEKSRPGNLTFL